MTAVKNAVPNASAVSLHRTMMLTATDASVCIAFGDFLLSQLLSADTCTVEATDPRQLASITQFSFHICLHSHAALTEVLPPKLVYITTPSACQQQLQQLKDGTRFVAAFTAPALQQQVEGLWQQLGRAGPPLFLKVRARSGLQEVEQQVGGWASCLRPLGSPAAVQLR